MTEGTVRNLVILGSTGSIGQQALDVVDLHPDKYRVIGLAARNELGMLREQVQKYNPELVVIGDENAYQKYIRENDNDIRVLAGVEGMCEMASMDNADTVLVSVSGAVGIRPTIAAINKGRRIALANKETLVAAGDIVMNLAREKGAEIIPVDSEHSAIYQCLRDEKRFLNNLWVTASGGPFREYSSDELKKVTVDMALKHPNWKMGPKITIDSATLMNKGLEVIEAHHLFAVDYEHIKVLVQRESVIHSMVEFIDGSFLGHLGRADMRIPIQYALTYPERTESPAQSLDFSKLGAIHFEKPDTERFPLLRIAYEAGTLGGTMPAVMNAANELAVHSFLNREISFLRIAAVVQEVMEKHSSVSNPDLEDIFAADAWARENCAYLLKKGVR